MDYDTAKNTGKEKYHVLCKSCDTTIFQEPWWLDAVCGEYNWSVALYESRGDI